MKVGPGREKLTLVKKINPWCRIICQPGGGNRIMRHISSFKYTNFFITKLSVIVTYPKQKNAAKNEAELILFSVSISQK